MLGVSPRASFPEIKKAYKRLAARYHPDKHGENELADLAREKLSAANAAYDVLKDPNRRADYDRARTQGRPTMPSTPPSTAAPQLDAMLKSILRLALVLAVVFFSVRFVRSPRALLVIAVAILIAWFLPRIVRKLKR